MNSYHWVLALLWVAYCALHSILAAGSVKKRISAAAPGLFKYYRIGYIVFALVGLVGIVLFALNMRSPFLFQPSASLTIVGSIIGSAGLVLMLVCIKKYFLGLSGLQALLGTKVADHSLKIKGVHRFLRHPLYLGTFAALWGAFLIWPTLSFFITNVVITVYTVIAIKWEEEKLIAEFGEDYKQYQKKVSRLIPGVY